MYLEVAEGGAADLTAKEGVVLLLHNPAKGCEHGHAAVSELGLAEALGLADGEVGVGTVALRAWEERGQGWREGELRRALALGILLGDGLTLQHAQVQDNRRIPWQ